MLTRRKKPQQFSSGVEFAVSAGLLLYRQQTPSGHMTAQLFSVRLTVPVLFTSVTPLLPAMASTSAAPARIHLLKRENMAPPWHGTSGSAASNAAPEWQAGRLGWRSRDLVVACPLEGLVRLLKRREALTHFTSNRLT
jgi:hypothetical protein